MIRRSRSLLALAALACWGAAFSQTGPSWRILKPSNTGVPGELVDLVRFAPDGRLWVGAHWVFWGEGGIGILDRTDLWTDYANWETPLPSALVLDLAFAHGGVVWIATDEGLVKKDGDAWTVYTTANAPLLHNSIMSVDVDAAGHVWVNNSSPATTVGAIFEFDGSTWHKFQVGQQLPWTLPWGSLSDVKVDHNGHVWVANQVLNGVAEYNGMSWTLHGAAVDRFDRIEEDGAGNLWLRAGVGGFNAFYKFDHLTFTSYPEPTTPTALAIDANGAVFLGNWNGRVRKSVNGGQTWSDVLTGLNPVFQIAPDPLTGELWIGTRSAVGRFTADGGWKRDYNTYNTGLPDYFVDGMAKDGEGNFWVATGEAGLSRFDGVRWRNWGEHNLGAEPYPFSGNEPMGTCYQDRSGEHWMGGNGIARWESNTGAFTGFWNWQSTPGMPVTLFRFFAEDGAGRLFAAGEEGAVFSFDGAGWVREPVTPYVLSGLPGMRADSRGNVWLASTFALHRWDGRNWDLLGDEWLFFDWGGVTAFTVGPDDTLWIGTISGLARWNGVSLDLFDTSNSPLPANAIRGIDVRADGTVAVSASDFGPVTPFPAGVAVLQGDPALPQSWKVYPYGASPLPHYQLGPVTFDAAGTLWVSALSEGVALVGGCTPTGWINLLREEEACGARARIGLTDCDLDGDPTAVDEAIVRVTSNEEPAGELVSLTEIAPHAGVFTGEVTLGAFDRPGVLHVGAGDTVQASYLDGNVLRTDVAAASCALVPMSQTLRALDRVTFGWSTPLDVDWVRGELSGLASYAILDFRSAPAASTVAAPETPAPGTGFYWLVRPDGPQGSWSSGGPGESDRDAHLPLP